MSFAEWMKQKKKEEEELVANTKAVNGNKITFSEWIKKEKASNVDPNYINTFIKDAEDFLGTSENEFKNLGWQNAWDLYSSKQSAFNDLETRYSYIGEWLNQNKNKISAKSYQEISDVIYSCMESSYSVVNSFKTAKDFYSQFETEDSYNNWYESHKKKAEEEQKITGASDYEEYSQKGASIENPTMKEAEGWMSIGDWRLGGEDVGNIVTYSRENADELRMGAVNNAKLLGDFRYSHMTDTEVGIYNYYLAKYGEEKASEYLKSIDDELDQREAGKLAESFDDNVFLEALMGFSAGVETSVQGLKGLADFVTGNTSGTDYTATQYADQIIASNNEGILKGIHDVSSVIGGMTPSILASTLTGIPLVGATVMGGSAMGNAYNEMVGLGYNEWQARGYGLLVGASEAVLQYALGGISKLGGKLTGNAIGKIVATLDNALARTAIQLGGNMASEGLEEAIQTILEPAFKSLMTGEEFDAPKWEDIWYSALLGALSAGMLEGVPTIAGTTASSIEAKKVYGSEPQALVTEALDIDPENAHAQRMQARLDSGKNVSGYQLNRLVEANEQALVKQDTSKMKSAVEARLSKLGEKGDIGQLSDILVKKATGETLTLNEKTTLKKSTYGQRVANELDPGNIKSGKFSSEWAENIGTERINTEAYNKGLYDLATEQAGIAVGEEKASVTKNPTAGETATEAKFEVSTDGKTKVGDMEVSIKEIASVKDGEMILRLEDGSTVNANDVEYGSSEEGLLYENVVHMNLNAATANAFVKGYDPSMGVQEYALGFSEAYRYGEYGYPVQKMSADGFSAMLSESQKNLAYNLGKTDAKYKVESKQAKIASTSAIKEGKDSQKTSKKGKLHNTLTPTTERHRASLKTLGVLAEALGIDIYTFESKVDENGNRYYKKPNGEVTGANGWFDPNDNSIHIDLHAGASGEGTMLFTAAHELTHFIREWSPAKFKVFADFLLEQYGKKGVSVDALVKAQIEKAKNNGRSISYDTAYEEVIADSCEAMLADGDVVAKIAELKAKDKTLWEKIKDFITKLVERIKAAYEGMTPDSAEGEYVAKMLDTAERLKALWTEALVEASDNYVSAEKTLFDNGIVVDSKTESASLMSVRDLLNSEQQQKVAKTLAERFGVTVEEAKGWISAETSLASLILNPKYSKYLDYVADPNEEAVKSNSDYPQGTVDFSNICKKRRDFTEVMNRVLRNFPNHVFEATDLAKIRTIMSEEGMEVACGGCYVEDRRQLDSIVAQNFIDSLALYRSGSKTKPDGTPFNANQLKAFKLIEGDTYTPSIYELISLEGRNILKSKNPKMEEAWVKFNNARGMQSVRLLLNDAEYKRQILKYSPTVVKRKNDLGGLRIYSFSDMEMFHLIDIIQVITDSATVGLSLQGYTKVNEYAKAVKDTGEKLNRSLIPKGDLGYHVENGRIVLDYDTVEGIDVNHPDFFDNIDNPNIGNIVIGINATQIKAAMTSKFIDQIIPFHTGQSNDVLGEKGIATWANYKDFQSERDLSTGKKSSHQINIYTEVIQAAEAEGKPIKNKVDFVNKFLKVCKENNLEPRFSEFLNVDENGDYIYTEGYHKFLVDFKTFDQNTGEYLPQMPVKPIFENKYITKLLKDYVKTQKKKDADFSKAAPKVLDRITNEIVHPEDKVKYSDRVLMGSLFSGGGTLEAGLAYQMLDKEFGVEYDGKIASVYADNHGDHIQVGRVEDFDISKYDDIFYLHASPVCHNFSKAKHGAKELQMDIDSAKATANHLETAMPQVFTVENAPGYRKSQSLKIITDKLTELGYKWDVDVYNSADYGSATSRNRVILRAVKDGELPEKPSKQDRTNSWDKVTRDLWDTLPKSYLRPSFISAIENTKNLPILDANGKVNVNKPLLILTTTSGHMVTYCWEGEICPTLTTKCGEAKLVMPDGNIYAVTPEFMGRIQGLPDDYKYPNAKTRAFTIIGNGIPTHLTKAVVGGVLDSAYEQTHDGKVLYSDRASNAPTFYSHMGKVVDDIRLEKMGAGGVVSYLKGKGVKAEEIKWSGIEAFLEGKKSVTKAELQEFVAGSQLQIVEQTSNTATFVDDDGNTYTDSEFKQKAYAMAEEQGIDRDRVKFVLDPDDGSFVAYAGSRFNGIILEAEADESEAMTRWSEYKLDGGSNYRELVFQMPNSSYSNKAMRVHWGEDAEGVLAHARIQDFDVNGKKMLFVEEIQSDWHNEGHSKGYSTKEYEDAVESHDKLYNEYKKLDLAFHKYVRSNEFMTDPEDVRKKKHEWLRGKAETAQKKYLEAEKVVDSLKEKGAGDTPDAPFRTNYHEYVLKRLIRMAAEEDYDSLGWTPAEIQSKRWSEEFAEGYRIEYDQDIPSFLKKYGKKWGAKVGKTTIGGIEEQFDIDLQTSMDDDTWLLAEGVSIEGTEIWSMDIPDSMKDSVLHEGQVLYSDRSFASQVDAVLNGADTNSTHLKLMDTPSLLQEAGLPNLPILMTAKHLKKITAENGHGLDVEVVKNLPEYISSPVMIADSLTRDDSIVIITEAIDSENRPVVAAIMLNGTGQLDNKYVNANIMTSAYGRNNFQSFLNRIADSNSVIYWDKEKSQDLSVNLGVQFPNVITSLDSGIIIHQAKAFVNTQIKEKNSDRASDSVSNRSLLANALESVAQNDIERKKLEEYKGKIALIESEQAKLAEVRAKIKELSFAKGARDTEAIKSLQFEANQTANRINTYDKQLLSLESTTALKDVLQREKEMAYKRAEQRGREALKMQREKDRERNAKTQRELMTRYQESRKKNIEGRKKTEMRLKVKDVVNELYQYLDKGTKEKHVPIFLQKPISEALAAVNMDTVGAEERIAKKREEMRLAASKGNMDKVNQLAKEIEHIQEMGGNMEAKLSRLKTVYESIINSDDPIIANSHDEVIASTIDKVIEVVGNTPLRDMSLYQLEAVYDMYRMVLTSVRNANKAFKAEKGKEISALANTVISDLNGKKRNPLNPADTNFAWNNLKPVYAFERIGSNTFTKLFNAVREGEDVWAKDMSEAQAFREKQSKKHKFDSWDFKKKYHFTTNRGTPFELDLGEMMSIYAFAKDEHSKGHLIGEGFVFDPKKEVVENVKGKIKVKVNLEDATSYNLSDEIVADIISQLTPEQKEFADAMQDYLSTTMGEKGNEVSLELYQIKLFKNKNYFPLKVAPQYMAVAKEQTQGEVKIKNKGFTKDRKAGARNPIVLSSFMDVWANHVNEMSMYHAFTLPLEDFYRVFGYKTPKMEGYAPMSVNASIQNAYGKGATKYIDQLLKDLNGGARVDSTAGIINKLTGLFKKSAVFGSLSVVVQQPSAIARATALVDTKYFVGKPSGKHKETWAEVKKYAPVAIIKEMGYFDTGMGQSSVEWLKGDKTWKDKADDVVSKAPALADEYAWCAIWNAVKRETLHTHKDLKPNSEEFLKAVGERFTEVITKTQVYDSVLARSANMRSKDTGMKMATAFMGEPTTSINMLQDALTQGKRGNKRYARKAIGGVIASMILNSILVSFIYAGRDDDEEKTYTEKYIGTLTEEMLDSINPFTLIPFVKDIVSIAQGYDVERSDMAVITDLINAWNNLESDNRSVYRKVEDFAGAIASIFGLPVKNVMRDARGIYNTVNSFINGEKTTGAGIKDSIVEAVTGDSKSNGQQLYEAIISGDSAQIERVKGRFDDQKAINSAIRQALRDNDSRIKQAAEARYNGDIAGYMRIAKEIIAEGHFKQDDIVSAINSEINALKKGEGTTESSSSNKATSIYKVDDYYAALVGRDQATAYVVKEDLIKTDIANGKDRDEAEADFNSKFASHIRELYEYGDISAYEAKNMLVNYGGRTEDGAEAKIQYWDFKKRYPDYELSEEAVTKYYNDVEPYGIDVGVYYDYSKQRSKCKGTDSDGDGKTDSGSVKRAVLQVIDSLPITYAQKDVLYYLNGWSASTIWEAPWH